MEIDPIVVQSCGNLISSVTKMTSLLCIATCNSYSDCLTATFDNKMEKCSMFNRYFQIIELVKSSFSILYEKKSGNITFYEF